MYFYFYDHFKIDRDYNLADGVNCGKLVGDLILAPNLGKKR
jgi:hypothetical protein